MKKRGPVIAIDGPSGVGKSVISKFVAKELNLTYVDTGAMYRAFALVAFDAGINLEDESGLKEFSKTVSIIFKDNGTRVFLNGKDYSIEIRSQRAGELASIVSTKKAVREFLVNEQKKLAQDGFCVMEGRDIGTVVCPDADVKIFLDAEGEARATRRHVQLKQAGKSSHSLDEIGKEISERDRRDTSRAESPLKKADDAILIDTTSLTLEEVLAMVLKEVKERIILGDIHR
ncbi:MAG: (d)CMP kinase [Thermodesulfobacteriota bacterium]